MQKYLIAIVTLYSLAYCQDKTINEQCKKTYVQPQQIALTPNEILVCVDNQWISTDILRSDAQGIYICKDERDWLHWKCPRCGHMNSSVTDSHCTNCGY